jgi:5-formyltetrahydrofolate cyclo-ligase
MQSSDKPAIRKHILALREAVPAEARAQYSATITEGLCQLPEYRAARTVLGYMNFGSEFASELWVSRVLDDGKRLLLPRVNHHTNHLDLYQVEDTETQLETGLWNIREPVVQRCRRAAGLNEVEFALLPGVAFTVAGDRLGYGGGFYDKLLAGWHQLERRPALVAAAFSLQVVPWLPQEATDVAVQKIVTEQAVIACAENLVNGDKEN